MEGLIIADTDVIIDFFADIPPYARVVSTLIESSRLAITAVTVYELYAGVVQRRRLSQVETLVKSIPVFPLSVVEAAIAGKIYTDLKAKGKLIGNQDILISGICIATSLPLLTKNVSHFASVEGLILVNIGDVP